MLLPRRYVVGTALFSLWGVLSACWASSWDQALLFALLPPIVLIGMPILGRSWQRHPWCSALSLAAAALCLFSLDSSHILGSWLTGDIPYRMPH